MLLIIGQYNRAVNFMKELGLSRMQCRIVSRPEQLYSVERGTPAIDIDLLATGRVNREMMVIVQIRDIVILNDRV